MDKSNEKDKTRNRYAKLQPLVDRINEHRGLNSASSSANYHPAARQDECSTYQLRNDFSNLVLGTCRETQVIENSMNTELRNSKMPLFDQSVFSSSTNNETPRKPRKYKQKNKEKLYRTSPLDLRPKLLDILCCILHIMCSPIVFFAKVFLTLIRSSTLLLYNILKFCLPRSRNSGQEQNFPQPAEKKREGWSRLPINNIQEKQEPDLKKFLTKRSSDHDTGNCFVSPGVLHSDCLSYKYSRSFLDYRDCRKRAARQYQDSITIAGKKISPSKLGNFAFKGSKTVFNSKRLRMASNNSSHKSEFRLLMKNRDPHLSGASESPEQLQRICSTNQPSAFDRHTDSKIDNKFNRHKKSSGKLLTNLRKKSSEKFRLHAFTPLPLRPTLQKKSLTENEKTCEEMSKKCDRTLSVNLKSDLATLDLQNVDSQPVAESNYQVTKKLERYIDIDKDLSQMKQLNDTASIPISLNQYNTRKLVSEFDVNSSNLQSGLDLGAVKNEAMISKSSKAVPELEETAQNTGYEKQTGTSESPSIESPGWDLSQSKEIPRTVVEEKTTNESEDRLRATMNEKSRTAEFTKPVDAKSKWIEMKKKFYGKDYVASKDQLQKSEALNLSQVTSVSQLPAHKVFQYNMQVGRARQMETEPPLSQDIFLKKKTTSSCLETLQNCSTGCNLRRNDPQLLKSAISTSRCLLHTQSLSQWPVDLGYPYRGKKYHAPEQKPKPKPRTGRDGKITAMGLTTALSTRRPATCTNSSVSSSNVRDDQILQSRLGIDWSLQEKNPKSSLPTENTNMCDEYAGKIDSLISVRCHPFSVSRKLIDRNVDQGNRMCCESAAGDSS